MTLARRGKHASASQFAQERRDRQHPLRAVLQRPVAQIHAECAPERGGIAHQAQQLAVEQEVVSLRLRQVPAQDLCARLDAAGIACMLAGSRDSAYLTSWAHRLGLEALLREAAGD